MDKHLSLSLELIYLMGWLLKHEKSMLNSLVKNALKNGLAQDLEKAHFDEPGDVSLELQTIILEFLSFLERSLAKNLDASLENSQGSRCSDDQKQQPDVQEIKLRLQRARQLLAKEFSTETATVETKDAPNDARSNNARKGLLDQVLKTWKPNKYDLVH